MKNTLNFYRNLPEGFVAKRRTMFGKNMVLITPTDIKTKWCEKTEFFRSCLFDEDTGKIYSLGFKKFKNWGEDPEFQPWDHSWEFEARYKVDGSLLCISKIDGNILMRTRGVFDAREHETGDELDGFIEKYPLLYENEFINSENYTILCEHTTPKRIIVLRESDEPKLTLLGIICHKTGQYVSQCVLDGFAQRIGIDRPQKYIYKNIADCIADVEAWRGKEGVVAYSPDGQTLKKFKSSHYLSLHKLSFGLRGLDNVLDLFVESPRFLDYQDFYNYVLESLDFEIAEKIKDEARQITDAYAKFVKGVEKMRERMEFIRNYATRKEQAAAIQEEFTGWKTSIAFLLLDNREIDDKVVRKAMEKILEL